MFPRNPVISLLSLRLISIIQISSEPSTGNALWNE